MHWGVWNEDYQSSISARRNRSEDLYKRFSNNNTSWFVKDRRKLEIKHLQVVIEWLGSLGRIWRFEWKGFITTMESNQGWLEWWLKMNYGLLLTNFFKDRIEKRRWGGRVCLLTYDWWEIGIRAGSILARMTW